MAEEKRKNCPQAWVAALKPNDISYFELCREGECAWWFASEAKCSRLIIAESLHQIASHSKFQ